MKEQPLKLNGCSPSQELPSSTWNTQSKKIYMRISQPAESLEICLNKGTTLPPFFFSVKGHILVFKKSKKTIIVKCEDDS